MMTKLCPMCAEEIKKTAIKCKHCCEYLTLSTESDTTETHRTSRQTAAAKLERVSTGEAVLQTTSEHSDSIPSKDTTSSGGIALPPRVKKHYGKRAFAFISGGTGALFQGLIAFAFWYVTVRLIQAAQDISGSINRSYDSAEVEKLMSLFATPIKGYNQGMEVFEAYTLLFTVLTLVTIITLLYLVKNSGSVKKKKIAAGVLLGIGAINYLLTRSEYPIIYGIFVTFPLLTSGAISFLMAHNEDQQAREATRRNALKKTVF